MATDTPDPGDADADWAALPVPAPDPDTRPVTDPIDPRPYLEIRPAETPVDPGAATRAMATIDVLLRETTQTGLRHKLRGTTITPVFEWLLVSDGRPDPTIRYLVGSNVWDLTEDLAGILRTCFPNTYEFSRLEWHPTYVQDFLPVPTLSDPPDRPVTDPDVRDGPFHPAITPATPYVAGVEYHGVARRGLDWQTPLNPFEGFTGPSRPAIHADRAAVHRVPLAGLVEALHDAHLPVLYQVVVTPYGDWTGLADTYVGNLDDGTVSTGDKIWEFLSPRDREARNRYQPPLKDEERIEGIAARDPRHTLTVSARAVALTREFPSRADAVARRLASVLSPLNGRFHEIVGHVATDDELYDGIGHPPGAAIYHDLLTRAVYPATYARWLDRLRRRPHESKGIVVAPAELPGFAILDAAGLTPTGRRAVAARPGERTGLPLPAPEQLAYYTPPGMALGMPLTHDRQPYGRPLTLPPADQDRHVIVIGPTGSGKSVLTEMAALTNVAATNGPAIFLDYKGGGTATEYLQTHFRAFSSLEDVAYFDCTRVLPALSVLDIRPLLEAGIPREEARSRIAGHYEEMLTGLMGAERYGRAVEAPKVIRNHLRALFDPVHGTDAVSHHALFEALLRTQRDDAPPPVADDRLADYFASLLERDRDVFQRILGGAANRVETIATDGRLAPVFDHVPGEGDPHFDFADVLNRDKVVIFDFGGMEETAKRTLTLAILSTLWRALQARAQDTEITASPLVNVYLEEAGALADSALLDTLLSQGRSFGCSLFLGVQFLGQLDSPDPTSRTHEEALNETATILAGQVATRDDLANALSTDAMPPAEVDRRLSRLPRGEWLVRPGTAFGAESVSPFLVESLPPPPGHPASVDPLTPPERRHFEAAFEEVQETSRCEYGLDQTDSIHTADEETEAPEEAAEDDTEDGPWIDTAYAFTKRMPEPVEFDTGSNALHCGTCGNRYDRGAEGMIRAIECCASLDIVDRDDVPSGDLNLKLSAEERRESPLSDASLRMLQAAHNAKEERFHPLEYDLTRDSMIRLQEYVGIEPEEVQALIDADLLRKDTDHPYRLYTVTPEGRRAIGEAYREGIDYGPGKGDLEESAQHRMGVIVAARYLERKYVQDPDSAAVRVEEYYDIGGNQRLDVAALDANGEVVIAVEVERVNHDVRRAAPDDFDKMAACEPEEAIWIAMSHTEAHQILAALNDPLEGDPRTTKTYAKTTPANDFLVDELGFTAMYTLDQIRGQLGLN